MSAAGSGLAIGSAVLGVGLLRASWSRRGDGHWLTAAGWAALFTGGIAWHGAGLGWDEAIAFAMLGPSLIGFLVLGHQVGWDAAVATVTRARARRGAQRHGERQESAQMRKTRISRQPGSGAQRSAECQASAGPRPGAAAKSDAGSLLGRGTARVLLAGPLALAAALGLVAVVALRMPWLEADRLVTAGFLLPVTWAAGAIWATMDSKLTRVALALGLTAIVCVSGAVV